jgi:hypothetical protein
MYLSYTWHVPFINPALTPAVVRRLFRQQTKRFLANLAKRGIAQLTKLIKTRLRRMQYQAGLIEGLIAGTRPDLTPLCNPQ